MAAIAATDKSKYQYIDYGDSDGVVIGQSSTKKIGLYGFTPVVQAAHIDDAAIVASNYAVNTATTDAGCVAMLGIATKLNTLLDDLSDLGIIASS